MMDAVSSAAPASPIVRVPARLGQSLVLAGFVAGVVAVLSVVHAREWAGLAPVLLAAAWLVAAALAVQARPDHPGAVLFAGIGAGHLIGFALDLPVALDGSAHGWSAWALNLVGSVAYSLGFAALAVFLATYPSGVARTRGLRAFARWVFPAVTIAAVLEHLTAREVSLVVVTGRSTLPAPGALPLVGLSIPFTVVAPLSVVVGVALLVARGRRATGDERRQLSWAVGAAGLLALLLLASPALGSVSRPGQEVVFVTLVSAIPFVLLAGLVRYRLMDVDTYVARALARGVVVVLVLTAYALASRMADRLGTGVNAILVVVAAMTGVPLIGLLEGIADRYLSGGRARGQVLMRQLADELAVPSRETQARLTCEAVRAGLDASWVRLRTGDLVTESGHPPAQASPALVVPLLAADAEVGSLECGPRHGAWGATEVEEVRLLARHAGLALHNSDLTHQLAQQVVELQASRGRLVRAEGDARARLERDLHDGIQQQVVAVIAHLGALRVLLPAGSREAELAGSTLHQAQDCLTGLREVVNGVQPPVLRDRGLIAAVESRSALLPLPVLVSAPSALPDLPEDVESAAYYVVSEALTNVVKHSGATSAEVRILPNGALVAVSVRDDGCGLEKSRQYTGLAGLRDRVEALGGTLAVDGTHGTTVTATLPLTQVGLRDD